MVNKNLFTLCLLVFAQTTYAQQPVKLLIGQFTSNEKVFVIQQNKQWGITVEGSALNTVVQPNPVQLEFYKDSSNIEKKEFGYEKVVKNKNGFTGNRTVSYGTAILKVLDLWIITGSELKLSRRITVNGNDQAGFMSSVTFQSKQAQSRNQLSYFAPGIIYGDASHLTEGAIGGKKFQNSIHIREDRMPAPLFGIYFMDKTSLTVLDPKPNGSTTLADANDTKAHTLIEEGLQTGAIGLDNDNEKINAGFWFPGTEGEVTYKGNTYPGGQMHQWRRRYHPLKNGLFQNYQVVFRFAHNTTFPNYYNNAWKWAWNILKPQVKYNPIKQVQRSLIDMLGDRIVVAPDGRSGIPMFVNAVSKEVPERHREAVMGFVGKNLEAAEFLLKDAENDKSANGEKHRQQAIAIINSFVQMKMDPPVSEGFNLVTGKNIANFSDRVYLRSLTDDFKATMRIIKYEKEKGREHKEWLDWCVSFGNWLLTQQETDGGIYRSWQPVTGKVQDSSKQSSYNAIPFLVFLSAETKDKKYINAAFKAAEYCWQNGQRDGVFVGGTIDNPDVIDKEAGTLSLEAYLALYNATNDRKWIDRAKLSGNFAETWLYIWNIPMATDADNAELHWKKGVPTIGLQLISSGHSLVDMYMSFDVDEFAKLYKYTNDPHYLELARLLLHNTKSMLALPGRTYDLGTPGWQQEHWSLAPHRGYGLHRGWLPWVSTSHLNGIFGLQEFDKALYNQLIKIPSATREDHLSKKSSPVKVYH